jgi:RNA polymerase sigma factor (sigma-70 family)
VRAFMHIRRWGVASSGLDPLLNRIARNLLIDRYRRTTPHLVPLDSADEIQDPAQDPTEEFARRNRRTAVQSAIRSLPVRHQRAITYSLSGLTPEEVGRQMGIGRNAADALLHRARRSLREHLAPVKDGMWGLAIGFKVRWSRAARRLGVNEGTAEAMRLSIVQSGIGIAAAAMVTVTAISGGASGATPRLQNFRVATHGTRAPAGQPGSSGAIIGSTGGASSGSQGGSGSMTVDGGFVSSNWGGGLDANADVPSANPGDPSIIGVDVHVGSDDRERPTDRRFESVENSFCKRAPRACWQS